MSTPASVESAESLNRDCRCSTLDPQALERSLLTEIDNQDLVHRLTETHPHLFAATAVFLAPHYADRMRAVIAGVETVMAGDAYRDDALARAATASAHDPHCHGVFFGYDFHVNENGPRLIEINTNAGGALLNVHLARAQKACCPEMRGLTLAPVTLSDVEAEIIAMFRHEWRLARGGQPLTRIAIVDEAPATQFLYPEFMLFQSLFRRHGIDALIADPAELEIRAGRLQHADGPVDLVYNRLTDFPLAEPAHAVLRRAWLDDLALITPHPRAHALVADKRNLIPLSDPDWLRARGVSAATIDILEHGIARTRQVEPAQAEDLWTARKRLFFKPASGYGAKAVYRGDKLTRRVWEDILAGDYVAQDLVPPGVRQLQVGTETVAMKYDLRCFVYDGRVQLLAARLYQGQTTNFRTPGGGFAPVFYPPPGATP